VGRFAPTPSGDLHLGSLYTAAASYLDARAHGGRWLLRIEDLDQPREVAGAAAAILRVLELFGFEWDGTVVRQSERGAQYEAALRSLYERNLTFACSCSRLQLEDELRYPGTCRMRTAPVGLPTATRLRIESGHIAFTDRIQGNYRQDVSAAVGDIILKRRDQLFAYVLAVVVDDAAQGITHVVRGADLLDNTPRQIYLQRLLGASQPGYAHVPVLTEPDDSKLAKSQCACERGFPAAATARGVFTAWIGAARIAPFGHRCRSLGLGYWSMGHRYRPKTPHFARKRLITINKNADLPWRCIALFFALLFTSKDRHSVVWHEPASSGGASANTSEEPHERTASDQEISESSSV
jgi:glutamyl-Q tRNA(Asp) synthetase